MFYAALSCNEWHTTLAGLNDMGILVVILITTGIYLFTSFSRVHSGASFPSDCVYALLPALVCIITFYAMLAVDHNVGVCPSCENTEFCYYN